MTDRVEIQRDGSQSDIFEDTFIKNLKGLQAKIKQQHIQKTNEQSPDLEYIGEATRKLVELKILELDCLIEARKREQEWQRLRELRGSQSERLNQARLNVNTLMTLHNSGRVGVEDDIEACLRIMREIDSMGSDFIVTEKDPTADKILESFHVTEKDLKKAFNKTNVIDVMRQAKNNGWKMTISEDEVALYRNGKRINGTPNIFPVDAEQPKEKNAEKKLLVNGKSKKYNAIKQRGKIKRK